MPKSEGFSPVQRQRMASLENGDDVNLDMAPSRADPVIPYQRRNLSVHRRCSILRYVRQAEKNVETFGAVNSSKWIAGILAEINEPAVIIERNLRDWMETNPQIFRPLAIPRLKIIPSIINASEISDPRLRRTANAAFPRQGIIAGVELDNRDDLKRVQAANSVDRPGQLLVASRLMTVPSVSDATDISDPCLLRTVNAEFHREIEEVEFEHAIRKQKFQKALEKDKDHQVLLDKFNYVRNGFRALVCSFEARHGCLNCPQNVDILDILLDWKADLNEMEAKLRRNY